MASHDVAGRLTCTGSSGAPALACTPLMTLGALAVGGQAVPLPPDPIPVNTQIPIGNLTLAVVVPQVGTVQVPVSGTLTLNRFSVTDLGADGTLTEHAPLSLSVSGASRVLGRGLVTIAVELDDYGYVCEGLDTDCFPVSQ